MGSKRQATYHGETPAQQRARILRTAAGLITPHVYDSLYRLGYEPESFDGMWKIPQMDRPVIWLTPWHALVCEVVYQPGTHRAQYTPHHEARRRWVMRRVIR